MLAKKVNPPELSGLKQELSPTYSMRYFTESIPKYQIPDEVLSGLFVVY